MNFGQRIDSGCKAKGITLTDLAKKTGMPSRLYLYRMKSGEKTGQTYLAAIAKALGCTVEWLTSGTGPAPTWAGGSSDYAGALASLDAAGAIVKQVAAARKVDAKAATEGIAKARALVEKLGGLP